MIDGEVVIVDHSQWNGLSNNSVLRTQVAGSILKVTDGESYKDPFFEANAADRAGDPMGGYHYVRVNGDARAQTSSFVNRLSEVIGQGSPLSLGRWLDCEDKCSPGTTPQERADVIYRMVMECEQKFGDWVGVYTNYNFWSYYMPHVAWAQDLFLGAANWRYFSKNYPHYPRVPALTEAPIIPSDFDLDKCLWWQYEGNGNYRGKAHGFPGKPYTPHLDYGRYMFNGHAGTMEEFEASFGVTPEPPAPPAMPYNSIDYKVVPSGLNVRRGPTTQSEIVGLLLRDETVTVGDVVGDTIWAEIQGGDYDGFFVALSYQKHRYLIKAD